MIAKPEGMVRKKVLLQTEYRGLREMDEGVVRLEEIMMNHHWSRTTL